MRLTLTTTPRRPGAKSSPIRKSAEVPPKRKVRSDAGKKKAKPASKALRLPQVATPRAAAVRVRSGYATPYVPKVAKRPQRVAKEVPFVVSQGLRAARAVLASDPELLQTAGVCVVLTGLIATNKFKPDLYKSLYRTITGHTPKSVYESLKSVGLVSGQAINERALRVLVWLYAHMPFGRQVLDATLTAIVRKRVGHVVKKLFIRLAEGVLQSPPSGAPFATGSYPRLPFV